MSREIDEGLERAERTKPIPLHLNTRVKFLWEKVAKNDTKRLAQTAGVSGSLGGGLRQDGGTTDTDNTTLSNNSATFDGGAVFTNFGTVNLNSSVVTDNTAGGQGGGIQNFDHTKLHDTNVSGNTASQGGGINNFNILEIEGSRITDNTATSRGGGVWTSQTAEIRHTTISENSVTGVNGQGGGLWNNRGLVLDDVKVVRNKTTDANSQGGGIYNINDTGQRFSGNLQLIKTKVTDNSSGNGTSTTNAGGVWTNTQFTVFEDSAISDNHPTNCKGSPITVDHCVN
ncbi:hypothetical protein [Kitasatospora sp. NPDC058190]|uniref:hypothetical protein n=1 Tax=Kitasatospora sp. NPDC058190 TaxID=3346371 RepID=UPI0036DAC859